MVIDGSDAGIDYTEVNRAFKQAIIEIARENQNQKQYQNIRVEFEKHSCERQVQSRLSSKRKIEFPKQANVLIHTDLMRPYEEYPFFHTTTHLVIKKPDMRYHHSNDQLMRADTFYAVEFWRSEFRTIFSKLEGVK